MCRKRFAEPKIFTTFVISNDCRDGSLVVMQRKYTKHIICIYLPIYSL